ncbi:peroxiredoxin [Bradyrhizobium prioriisuperbiae]|uniref:peroxiredoxin n=1 Tax=Bradyrhizobium prioriisuperbiae TaxID=2854389 RepID=UPI0028E1A371|nr:peroxiredoxin [Bradyrhizobium prioritasuperba]
MSKKTRKKSPSKPSGKPLEAAAKTAARASLKTSKTVSVKKSSSKAPAPAKTPLAPILSEGQTAPAFDLPRDGGQRASLRDYAGRKLVLFFYPRADTPGCTKEAIDFSRLAKEFAAAGADVVGASADSSKKQESFRNKHKLQTPLISDEQQEMLKAYGVWGEKSMYGRKFLGIIRTTILIAPNGKIARIWRNVKVEGHAEEVLAAVRSL